jgi:hypothetical protein
MTIKEIIARERTIKLIRDSQTNNSKEVFITTKPARTINRHFLDRRNY